MREPHGSGTQIPITELDVLWVTAGLGCDGETIAMTAATQPSIEDIVFGSLPWIPKIHFHNPFLAIENGDDFLRPFHAAAKGNLGPFILVVEGSIPNENNKQEGLLGVLGHRSRNWATDPDLRMDRPSGAERLGSCRGRDLRHLRRNSRHAGESHRVHGASRLSWAGSGSRRRISRSCAFRAVRPSPTT